jgi:predicted kinase
MNDNAPGSGKSTLSKTILQGRPSFRRLSIDTYIYDHHGRYGIDYPKTQYETYQSQAEQALRMELIALLTQRESDIILDFSFAFRDTRDEWKALVEGNEGRRMLLYLDVGHDEVRRRVKERNRLREVRGRDNADAAFDVTEEVLERYIKGFERPEGEG